MSELGDGRLFVWRGSRNISFTLGPHDSSGEQERAEAFLREWRQLYSPVRKHCPFCPGIYIHRSEPSGYYTGSREIYECQLCGFVFDDLTGEGIQDYFHVESVSMLESLDINSANLGMTELGTHLRNRFSDALLLTPGRFVRLVGDIYRSLGYSVTFQPETHDHGYDIVSLEHSSGAKILVQCKRYRGDRAIGVGVVREMLGVSLWETLMDPSITTVKIVTTSRFSSDAANMARAINAKMLSCTFELVDARKLLEALSVYNERLPPLELVFANRRGKYPFITW